MFADERAPSLRETLLSYLSGMVVRPIIISPVLCPSLVPPSLPSPSGPHP